MTYKLFLSFCLLLMTHGLYSQSLKVNNKVEQEYTKYFREFIPIKESIHTVIYSYEKKDNTLSIKGYNPALKLASGTEHKIPKDFYYFGYDSNPDSTKIYFLFYNEENYKSIIAIYDVISDTVFSNTFELTPFKEILKFSFCEDYFFIGLKDKNKDNKLYEISIDLKRQEEISYSKPSNIKDYFFRINTTYYNPKDKTFLIGYSFFNREKSINYIKSLSKSEKKSINIEIPVVEGQFAKYYSLKNINDSIYIIYGTYAIDNQFNARPFDEELLYNGLTSSTGNYLSFLNINSGSIDQHFYSFSELSNINNHIARDAMREEEETKRIKKNDSGKKNHYNFHAYAPQLIIEDDKIILLTYSYHPDGNFGGIGTSPSESFGGSGTNPSGHYRNFNFLLFESFDHVGNILNHNTIATEDYFWMDGYDGVTIEANPMMGWYEFIDLKNEKLLTCHNSNDGLKISYLGKSNLKYFKIDKENFKIIEKAETPFSINEDDKSYYGLGNSYFIEDSMFFIYGNITIKKMTEKAATYISLIKIE